MEDKLEEVIRQYPIQVRSRKRTRGAVILESEQGIMLLKEYGASPTRIEFEEQLKQHLTEQGYPYVDAALKNVNGEYRTRDSYGNYWIVRRWYNGTECDIRNEKNIYRCAAHLGRLHELMKMPQTESERFCQSESMMEEMERHNREMKRVRSYIRAKKQKNEMEICLLNSFQSFYQQACMAQSLLTESGYDLLWDATLAQGRIRHGSYTYHNLFFADQEIVTTGFERAELGIQMEDLYGFLRKVMEKNGWNWELGKQLIDAYQSERNLETAEKKLLYIRLLYPQKYWKLVNFYYNGRKSWLPAKNLEKLLRLCAQEEERTNFLSEAKKLLF